jgi:hypothetical protein
MFTSVKLVDGEEQKSQQEIEKELIEQKAREDAEATERARLKAEEDEKAASAAPPQLGELKEEDVFRFLSEKTGKQISGLSDLFQEKEPEIPEDVASFLKYKKETGRGIYDYMKLQRDLGTVKEDELLAEYFLATEEGVDETDMPGLLAEFQYDEDIDDESQVRKAKLAKKQALSKAKKYFEEQKNNYKLPIEQIDKTVIRKDSDEYKTYEQWLDQTKQREATASEKRAFFMKKTEELFNPGFKGFEFNVDDKSLMFTPGDPKELFKLQSDPMNFVGKYVGADGNIADVEGYHRALSVAMNPEKFAKHFFDQGVAKATEELMGKMKNVDMKERQVMQTQKPAGMQIKEVSDQSFSGGLKIRNV